MTPAFQKLRNETANRLERTGRDAINRDPPYPEDAELLKQFGATLLKAANEIRLIGPVK